MKKILSSLFMILIVTVNAQAQTVQEPDFVGECIMVKKDDSTLPLEKQLSQNRVVASTGLILTGFGKVRSQIQIDGCCSATKINKDDQVKLIIRNVDNMTDPLAIIQIFKMEVKKKYRRAELASVNSFGSAKSNNLDYVSFTGKKFGTSSYLLTMTSALTPGEYGITISNPNALDQKQTVVSTFAVSQ